MRLSGKNIIINLMRFCDVTLIGHGVGTKKKKRGEDRFVGE
jgi:hypothetical protein